MWDRTGDGTSALYTRDSFSTCNCYHFFIFIFLCFASDDVSLWVWSCFYHSVDVVLCITGCVWFWRFMIPIPVPVSIAFNGVLSSENRFMMMFQEQRNIRTPWTTGGTLGNNVKEEWKKLQESCDLNLHYPPLPCNGIDITGNGLLVRGLLWWLPEYYQRREQDPRDTVPHWIKFIIPEEADEQGLLPMGTVKRVLY